MHNKQEQGGKSETLQMSVSVLYGLEECMGLPQVAKGSGSAAKVGYSPRPRLPTRAKRLTGPQPQKVAQVSPAPSKYTQTGSHGDGMCTFTGPAKGLSEEIQYRVPLPHKTFTSWGPGNYSPDNSTGPQTNPGEAMGSRLG